MSDKKTWRWRIFLMKFFRFLLITAVIGGTYYGVNYLMNNKPRAKKKKPERKILVTTTTLSQENKITMIVAMGTVIASDQIGVYPQISGEIEFVPASFVPGGFIEKGKAIAKIDPEDEMRNVAQAEWQVMASQARFHQASQDLLFHSQKLILNKKRAQADLHSAHSQYKAAQARAQRLKRLGKGDLASQEQYDAAEAVAIEKSAKLESAKIHVDEWEVEENALDLKRNEACLALYQQELTKVALAKARKRLEHTNIIAPFDAIVEEKYISLGSQVTPATKLATLIAVDEYWVEVSIPIDRLSRLKIPMKSESPGSPAKIYHLSWGQDQFRSGFIKKLLPKIQKQGRMARLLVAVKDPSARKKENRGKKNLLLDSLVRVIIEGEMLQGVIAIPRNCLHDGEYIWIYHDGFLKQRKINKVIWSDKDFVYIRDEAKAGEKLITSDIPGAINGMKIQEYANAKK